MAVTSLVVHQAAGARHARKDDFGALRLFSFCPACGSTNYWEVEASPGDGVPISAFADPRFSPTKCLYLRAAQAPMGFCSRGHPSERRARCGLRGRCGYAPKLTHTLSRRSSAPHGVSSPYESAAVGGDGLSGAPMDLPAPPRVVVLHVGGCACLKLRGLITPAEPRHACPLRHHQQQ